MGGWQADLTSVGPTYGLPAAGVILSSTGGTATLTNDGSIGALSDLAVSGDPQIVNSGTITGFVQFGSGDNSILNNGTFDLRHFADTNGDGVRDTVRVAMADLGDGPSNSFTNNGTLALPASDRRHDAGQHGAVSPARERQQRNGARRAAAGPVARRGDFHQLGHDRSAKQPRRRRRARDQRRAPGRGCRSRHLHLQWRHADARYGAQRRRRLQRSPIHWSWTAHRSAPTAQRRPRSSTPAARVR